MHSGKSFFKTEKCSFFFKNIITGDDKWLFYDNVQHKRPLQTPQKSGLPGRKVTLAVWWDHCGIILFEFSNHNQTLNASILSTAAMCA